MTSRKKRLYKEIFNFLRSELFVNPERFTSDYETAMRGAAKQVWPNIEMPGCTFHYRQAMRRNYMKRVKKPSTNAQKKIHFIIKLMIYNLQMLPSHMILEGMIAIQSLQRRKGVLRAFASMNNYILTFWLGKVSPENFSMYRILHRTNNFNESLNSRMNTGMCKHPNCYQFLDFMRKVMINENHRIQTKEIYSQQSNMSEPLTRAWGELDRGEKSIKQFLLTKFSK